MKKLGYILLNGLLRAFSALPLKVHYFNSNILCFLMEKVAKYRRDDVIINLSRCFPDLNYADITQITHRFYRHFADLIAETIWFGGCRNPKRLRDSHIMEVINPGELQRLHDVAPSVMVMYSHCGNWELFGGIPNVNYTGEPFPYTEDNSCVVYRKLKSEVWDRILRENRFAPLKDRDNYGGYIESKMFVRYAFSHRNEKKMYNVNTDQRPYFDSKDDICVPFFYKEVATMSGAAALARKFGMAVAFLKMDLVERGHYSLEYVTICDDASKMSVEEIMKTYYKLLEEEIKARPENYLWTHHRWWRQ